MGIVTQIIDLGGRNPAELRIVTGTAIRRGEGAVTPGRGLDLRIREEDGAEHSVRLEADIPLRTGEIVRYVTLAFDGRLKDRQASIPYRLVNLSTAECHDLAGTDFLEASPVLRISRAIARRGGLVGTFLAWPFTLLFTWRHRSVQADLARILAEACSAKPLKQPVPPSPTEEATAPIFSLDANL